MIERSRRRGIFIIGLLVCAGAAAVACTADDPFVVAPSNGGGTDAGDGGGSGAPDAGVPADASDDDASQPTGTCPTTIPSACAPANIPYGTPALQIDTCMGPATEGYVSSWSVNGGTTDFKIQGSPGALYCKNALGGRPGLVFDKDGFTIPAGALPVADSPNGAFTIVAVLQYTSTNRADTVAGGVVFERNAVDHPYDGPSLITNFAYQAAADPSALVPTNKVAGAMRFGVEGSGPQGYAIASTTPGSVDKPFVAIVTNTGQELTLTVDGNAMAPAVVSATYQPTAGNGLDIRIGHGSRPGRYFLGTLSELVYYSSPVADAQAATIAAGLKTKWGIQ